MEENQGKIKITWEDVEQVTKDDVPDSQPGDTASQSTGSWGVISRPGEYRGASVSSDNIWLRGWFYLGAAGLSGALLAWMVCEPSFVDGSGGTWANSFMFTLMVILMCIAFGVAESIAERTWHRTLVRGLAAAGLGLALGFIFNIIANLFFNIFLQLVIGLGVRTASNPLLWFARSFAWAIFGIAAGLVFGIVSKSGKKVCYGMLGGAIGAAIGGLLFDPISLLTQTGGFSRAVGMMFLGASTGIAMGLVENVLKERWLYVSQGPLAGKQFILYQDYVEIGKGQDSAIYLFKDPSILERHAVIERRSGKSVLTAFGPVLISGKSLGPGMNEILQSGDIVRIGRYAFSYAEKERARKP